MIARAQASPSEIAALSAEWSNAWPDALAAWSKFTRLRPPTFCTTVAAAEKEGLTGSFAMIRLVDQAVIVSLPEVLASGVQDLALEILAHEVGHHVLAPATLTDHGRMIARMRWALPTIENQAPLLANLYTDLVINDRLQRAAGLRMNEVYAKLSRQTGAGAVWAVYLRIYEVLWSLSRGSLGGGPTDDRMEGDALLGARLLRSFAHDWLEGSGRFAALFFPYLLEDKASAALMARLFDTRDAAAGGHPAGLAIEEAGERSGAVHPAQDIESEERVDAPSTVGKAESGNGQTRQPFEYGEILRAAGLKLSDHEVAVRYYRERARPFLVRYPTRVAPRALDPLPEGLEPWDIGQPLDAADWLQSVLSNPNVVPGMTTVQRVWGSSPGGSPTREPLDLDIYVDSSGSMRNPQQQLSFPALAGAIICLSALRAGARVQATLWSGKDQFLRTQGFVRDESALLRVLTGHFGGATAFPIHCLRDTFENRKKLAPPAHILVVSDDGVSTMFDRDERGNSGWEVTARALESARGGGTLVLQLPPNWEQATGYARVAYDAILRAREQLGLAVHAVASLTDLVAFARAFSRARYGSEVEE